MKTPEEIKEGLEICVDYYANGCAEQFCDDCPYSENECFQLEKDALVYIQQLESRLAQVERERDAAMNDLTHYAMCAACKHFNKGGKCIFVDDCMYGTEGRFEWRGVCEENSKEDKNG